MLKLHNIKVNLGFLVNPFYIFALSFSVTIIVYIWGWSAIYPKLSEGLILFLLVSALIFVFAGNRIEMRNFTKSQIKNFRNLNEIIFGLIITLGILNVFLMGYLPVLSPSHDYREFGIPVLDPVANTLSIFFSVSFFHSFLLSRNSKFLFFVIIILIFQILLFRRSSIVWIITSSTFLYLFHRQNVKLLIIVIGIALIPVLSYCFGCYGNKRSNLTESYVINDLGASDSFKHSGISYNHYITYLYVSSPLANLQKNINEGHGFLNNGEFKDFFFYSILPQSFTIRMEKSLKLTHPECFLIMPHLIAGTFLMVGFFTLGWFGMTIMIVYLFLIIVLCLMVLKKWNTFNVPTFSLLVTTISLLIFSNFLNRFDIILLLFVYPVFFHFLYSGATKIKSLGLLTTPDRSQPSTCIEQQQNG
jgi:hypothetical protein